MIDFNLHDMRIAAADHYVKAVYGEAKWFDTEEEMQDYITNRRINEMATNAEDQIMLEQLSYFCNLFQQNIADRIEVVENQSVVTALEVISNVSTALGNTFQHLANDEALKGDDE